MNRRALARGVVAVVLFAAGLLVALPTPYRERTFVFQAGGCRLDTGVMESKTGSVQGAVVLFPGLVANKKVMSYLARGFAAQNLRVIVPDLPGHGRTPGPFSPQRAEDCSTALLPELFARGLARPDTLILAGHSMGAAIALRVADRIPVAGTIAISPAPMRLAHGTPAGTLLFEGPPVDPRNTLVISGQVEMESMSANAADLISTRSNGSKYEVIPGATHVSLIFDPRVVRESQQWAARLLGLEPEAQLPSRWPLLGSLAGFAGLLLIAGPFLREVTGPARQSHANEPEPITSFLLRRALVTVTIGSVAAVAILRWWNPFRSLRIFEGDYFAGFLLILSAALLLLNRPLLKTLLRMSPGTLLRVAFAAAMLLILFTGWLELTLTEAWLNAARWARFPFLLLLVLPYHFAEEGMLGSLQMISGWRRLAAAMSFRCLAWLAILAAIFYLQSGEVLLALLAPYFTLVSVLQRCGMDLVRRSTGSAAAAAVFGAILLAGFLLVIFPVT